MRDLTRAVLTHRFKLLSFYIYILSIDVNKLFTVVRVLNQTSITAQIVLARTHDQRSVCSYILRSRYLILTVCMLGLKKSDLIFCFFIPMFPTDYAT